MTARITILLISLLPANFSLFAQAFPAKSYPKGYFSWPVDAKKGLAANFGELRPNHYHMGLDCKTDQKENKQVLAAADGYIAKVKIEPFGFGRCIYINHPNGLTTLYAHLNDFNPALEKYITGQQYKLQSWKIFIGIPASLFPVKKGQFIAWSGNTGGSQGPHTHFEIRDTKTDKVLNPLLFGLPVTDEIPPYIQRLAVYDRNISTYEQSPRFYPFKKINGIYTTSPHLLICSNKVSFAITAYDKYTGSTAKNGIYQAILYEDGRIITGFQIDSITYDETRYVNAHIDYKLRNSGGPFVQHLSRLPGYPQGVYQDITGNGVIEVDDDNVHQIKIEVKDAKGNASLLEFELKRNPLQQKEQTGQPVAYQRKEFQPGFVNVFENNNVVLYLPEIALYDSVRFKYGEVVPARGNIIYQLHNGNIPVHCMFPVEIKNLNATHPDKMVMHRFWKDKDDYAKAFPVGARLEKGWYQASFRALGNFQLIEDTIPPAIIPIGVREGMNAAKLNRIAFVIKDNTKELENFTAWLDGKWIRFSNDKGATFIYKFDEHCPPGAHELKISVADCVGNRAERTYHFSR